MNIMSVEELLASAKRLEESGSTPSALASVLMICTANICSRLEDMQKSIDRIQEEIDANTPVRH